MSGAGFVLAINLFVAGLFSVAFLLVAANTKSDRVAVWFGTAYFCGLLYIVFEFLVPLQVSGKITGFLAFTAFLGALISVTIGVARRYRVTLPWRLFAIAIVGFLVVNWFAFDLGRQSFSRMMAYQAPYAAMQAICALIVLQSRRRQPMDVTLMIVFTLSAIHFLSKPFIAQLTGGPGATAQDYIATQYALYSQTAGAVVSVATGLLMLMVLVRDMLLDVTARSETDPLSGLFNRRGFEDRVEPGLLATSRGGVPASLVAIDLDHFKSVNDTFGHDVGDRVIQSFAMLVKSSSPPGAASARMGGEEFAVFLPGANLTAARLFAETLRSAFARLPLPDVPEGTYFTASFGVAEASGNESFSDLRRRADAALYAAKKSGRDRVCVASDPAADIMPYHPLHVVPPKRRPARSA